MNSQTFIVYNFDKTIRFRYFATSFECLKKSVENILSNQGKITIVFDSDGRVLSSYDFLLELEFNTEIMVLDEGQYWEPRSFNLDSGMDYLVKEEITMRLINVLRADPQVIKLFTVKELKLIQDLDFLLETNILTKDQIKRIDQTVKRAIGGFKNRFLKFLKF